MKSNHIWYEDNYFTVYVKITPLLTDNMSSMNDFRHPSPFRPSYVRVWASRKSIWQINQFSLFLYFADWILRNVWKAANRKFDKTDVYMHFDQIHCSEAFIYKRFAPWRSYQKDIIDMLFIQICFEVSGIQFSLETLNMETCYTAAPVYIISLWS